MLFISPLRVSCSGSPVELPSSPTPVRLALFFGASRGRAVLERTLFFDANTPAPVLELDPEAGERLSAFQPCPGVEYGLLRQGPFNRYYPALETFEQRVLTDRFRREGTPAPSGARLITNRLLWQATPNMRPLLEAALLPSVVLLHWLHFSRQLAQTELKESLTASASYLSSLRPDLSQLPINI